MGNMGVRYFLVTELLLSWPQDSLTKTTRCTAVKVSTGRKGVVENPAIEVKTTSSALSVVWGWDLVEFQPEWSGFLEEDLRRG